MVLLDQDIAGPTQPPSPGSKEVVAELRTLRPDLPVLLLCGPTSAEMNGACTCLRKPFTLEDLLAALQPIVK
jgi:hypothetical protein